MSRTISITLDDATTADMERIAQYRFGATRTALSEYAKLATVQLLRRDLAAASKQGKTTAGTEEA